jgi:deoxyribonuclease V
MREEHLSLFFEKMQEKLSTLIKISKFDVVEGMLVCGLDAAYKDDEGVAAAVVVRLGENFPVSKSLFRGKVFYEYVPGLLYVREAPLLLGALSRLPVKPDLLLVDGHGLAHPRRGGLASILGVLTDTPSIGIAKRLLTGNVRWEDDTVGRLEVDGECVGISYKNSRGRTLYASIGHLVDIQSISTIISRYKYEVPLPISLAHRAAKSGLME